jgi:hypothetical protein
MDIIARENEPHGNGDMVVLRDDELDAVAGGVADLKTEHTIFGALSSVINQVVKSIGDAMQSAARAG